jgi:hypothetical protein
MRFQDILRFPQGEGTHMSVIGWDGERLCLQIVTWSGTNKSINLKRRSLERSRELADNILSAWFRKHSRTSSYLRPKLLSVSVKAVISRDTMNSRSLKVLKFQLNQNFLLDAITKL